MTTRRQALAGLAGLLMPGTALAQEGKRQAKQGSGQGKPPAKGKAGQTGAAAGRGEAAARGAQPVAGKSAGQGTRPRRDAAAGRAPARPSPAESQAVPARVARPIDPDAPGLRPLDRTLVRGWLEANPDWSPPAPPPGQRSRLAEGKPLPPGIAARPLPPGLASTLPYFPGYRYAAAGPDLVLVESATGLVASLLPGALAR